eukprot:355818-Chlamydomonas_euryale.AAC.1
MCFGRYAVTTRWCERYAHLRCEATARVHGCPRGVHRHGCPALPTPLREWGRLEPGLKPRLDTPVGGLSQQNFWQLK